MDFRKLGTILMKWSLENNEYQLVYFLYSEFYIGIPNTYIYKMQKRKIFNSIDDFTDNHNIITGNGDIWLIKLLEEFKNNSQWIKLPLWDQRWGYIIKHKTVS